MKDMLKGVALGSVGMFVALWALGFWIPAAAALVFLWISLGLTLFVGEELGGER